jgi:hypothetical protein
MHKKHLLKKMFQYKQRSLFIINLVKNGG